MFTHVSEEMDLRTQNNLSGIFQNLKAAADCLDSYGTEDAVLAKETNMSSISRAKSCGDGISSRPCASSRTSISNKGVSYPGSTTCNQREIYQSPA